MHQIDKPVFGLLISAVKIFTTPAQFTITKQPKKPLSILKKVNILTISFKIFIKSISKDR